MSMIQFVANYDDLSTDKGYQFKFHCDKCGNGFMSSFQPSIAGTAGSLLRAAGDLFGGWVSSAGNSAYEIQRAVGGKGHDQALAAAVEEGKQHFHQCSRCGKWVCPDICWNAEVGQCDGCAPDYAKELAASHAQAKAEAARQQLYERAQQTDYASNVDMSVDAHVQAPKTPHLAQSAVIHCGNCNAEVGTAKFCPECGTPSKPPRAKCPGCGFQPEGTPKFCPECGIRIPFV